MAPPSTISHERAGGGWGGERKRERDHTSPAASVSLVLWNSSDTGTGSLALSREESSKLVADDDDGVRQCDASISGVGWGYGRTCDEQEGKGGWIRSVGTEWSSES